MNARENAREDPLCFNVDCLMPRSLSLFKNLLKGRPIECHIESLASKWKTCRI